MNKLLYLLMTLIFVVGITIGSSSNINAQQTTIPNWVKNTALWWGQGQLSDAEFIQALQWLINQGILNVPQTSSSQPNNPQSSPTQSTQQGFSGTECSRDQIAPNVIHMTGKYTNGPTAFSSISFTLGLLDSNGNVVATGAGFISNIGPYQTKIFNAEALYSGNFEKCDIQVDTALP